jgi:hypothetical protein
MTMPLSTHWRPVSCEEYECDQWVMGWDTVVDTSTELGKKQHHFLTHDRSRSYTMTKEGFTLVRFHYGPGNRPFAGPKHDHKVRVARQPNLLVVGGDWRGNPNRTPTTVHCNPEDWADDFANHQNKLANAQR